MADLNDVAVALQNLNQLLGQLIQNTALATVVPISNGGTGATTAAQALANLGAMSTTIPLSSNGMAGSPVMPLLGFKNADGTTIAAAASAGKYGFSVTPGTSMFLLSEAANSNTKTDTALTEYELPPNYIAGDDLTLTINCNYTLGTGTLGTHTMLAAAYLVANNGTMGATIIPTAAQAIPPAAGDLAYTVLGATLLPNSRLLLGFVGVLQETGGTGNITHRVNSVRIG